MKRLCVLFILFSTGVNAQYLFNEKYKDCISDTPCYYCGDAPARYKRDIRQRLQHGLDHGLQKWVGTVGHMRFEVEVDSTGHSCVKSIGDEVRMSDVKNTLRMTINGLYDWQPALLNGHIINSTVIIDLHFLNNRAYIELVKPGDF